MKSVYEGLNWVKIQVNGSAPSCEELDVVIVHVKNWIVCLSKWTRVLVRVATWALCRLVLARIRTRHSA